MFFARLIWCALLTALIVGSVQFAVQQWHAVPIIHAAEVFEAQKVESAPATAHAHAAAPAHGHGESDAGEHEALHRAAWTWVANVLHSFSMALLMFAVMGWWIWRRGGVVAPPRLALAVASAGLLSLNVWPALGLPAELPGMDAAALQARQVWWLFAAVSAALACAALAGIATRGLAGHWRWLAALLLLALPFMVGAPHPPADPLAGFSGQARAQLQELEQDFIWTTHAIALSFWLTLGCVGGWVFGRWVKVAIPTGNQPGSGPVR